MFRIKKIDLLVLKAFVGPFLATLLISVFVLVIQFFWLWIDEFVGKGLDNFTILQVVGLVALSVVPMALPLAVLLSSIMTFGNLGETFELVALKSSGISLLRFMRPLFIFSIFLSIIIFFFSNNVIPIVTLKLERLKYDIISLKPAFDIKEGIFYNKIDGFVIRIGKKEKDNRTIKDIVIFEKNASFQDNLIVAKSGTMQVSKDKQSLEFILKDGWRYEESGQDNTKTQFVRMGFQEYKKVFNMSSFMMQKTDEAGFKHAPQMMSIQQLNPAIDSLKRGKDLYLTENNTTLQKTMTLYKFLDTSWSKLPTNNNSSVLMQLTNEPLITQKEFVEQTLNKLNSIKENNNLIFNLYDEQNTTLNYHIIMWHKKFTLSAACLILFVIGASLGSIIRKGGLGMPLVFATIFFILFYILNTIGEKSSNEKILPPYIGMWISSAILLPIAIFLTYKAMTDSQIFNKEVYYRLFRKCQSLFRKHSHK